MSRLRDQIEAKVFEPPMRTMRRAPSALITIEPASERMTFDTRLKWSITATLGQAVNLNMPLRPGELDAAKESVVRGIVEAIHGEFREPLLDAQREAVYGDPERASDLIQGVLESMFGRYA